MPNPVKLVDLFTPDKCQDIFELIAKGDTLKEVAEKTGISASSIWKMRLQSNIFEQKFSQAREISFEIDADRLKTITQEIDDVNKARLISDNIKWILARRHPKVYGDRLDVNVSQSIDLTRALTAHQKKEIADGSGGDVIEGEIVSSGDSDKELTPQIKDEVDIYS